MQYSLMCAFLHTELAVKGIKIYLQMGEKVSPMHWLCLKIAVNVAQINERIKLSVNVVNMDTY